MLKIIVLKIQFINPGWQGDSKFKDEKVEANR